MATVEVRVLGRPNVSVDGVPVALSGRPLTLAVRLAVAGRHGVSASSLERDLWPGEGGSAGAVRVTLTRLRQALGESSITRRDTNYLFADLELDMHDFEHRVRFARDRGASIEHRLAAFTDALGMWTGRAFDGFDDHGWARGEALRLDELRETVIDERFDLLIDQGLHRQAIADLTDAHARAPTRERRSGLLSLALYQSGRQPEALAVIAETRRVLRDEMGLFTSAELDELELKILQHDPDLAVPAISRRVDAAAEVESRVRAATTLCRAAAYDDATEVLDEAEAIAEAAADRRSLAIVWVEQARLAMLSGTGDPHPLLDEAKAIGRETRDGRLLARSALVRAGSGVPPDRSNALLELMEPIELLTPDDPDAVHLLCFAAVVVTILDTSEAAIHLVDEAERLWQRTESVQSAVVLSVAKSLCGGVRGDPVLASAELAAQSLDEALALRDPLLIAIASLAAARARFAVGDLDGVEQVLPAMRSASQSAMLPFGTIRVHLCETMIALARGELHDVPALIEREHFEGVRLATHVVHSATQIHRMLLAYEAEDFDELLPVGRMMLSVPDQAGVWTAVLATCGDEDAAGRLGDAARSYGTYGHGDIVLAFAVEAAHAVHDVEVARWCASVVDGAGDRTLMTGLGTMVLGFAPHFAGLAHATFGDIDGARVRLERAIDLAHAAEAWLWHAHSTVELAHVLAASGEPDDVDRAHALVEEVESRAVVARSGRLRRRVAEYRDTWAGSRIESRP